METFKTIIIGGGAAGLFFAATVNPHGGVLILERQDRLGKKLSATGNGQGNLTNLAARTTPYFSFSADGEGRVRAVIERFDERSLQNFIRSMGGAVVADERGRVYPASRQASSVTDLLRYTITSRSVRVELGALAEKIEKTQGGFIVSANGKRYFAKTVLLCTGGKAAKNFGTDGLGYGLAKSFGHTLTPLYPSLVQLKTDTKYTKTLKGLRAAGAVVTAKAQGKTLARVKGDIIFTDYGVSGDAVFRLSAFLSGKETGAELVVDLLPELTEEELVTALKAKRNALKDLSESEIFCGILNNQMGRAVVKRVESNEAQRLAACAKAFTLPVTGTLGFDYAQVTKGGISLDEVDEDLQSKYAKGLYFAGEILDVDGECGGFNLQWAYSSARLVAETIDRGQV